MRARSVVNGLIGRPWIVIGLVAAVVFALWVKGTRTQDHHLKVAFDEAVSVAPGLDVQANGVDVGKVSSVAYKDGQAIVRIGISDDKLWPLHDGTTAALRFGTTVGNGTRRIDLVPGPASAPKLGEDGIIGQSHSVTPTEFDQVFQTLDAPTRADMQAASQEASTILTGRGRALGAGVRAAAPALEGAGGVLGDLAADTSALRSFVGHSDRVMQQLDARRPQISALMTVGARTFDTFARNTDGVQRSLDAAPAALRTTQSTLARLDTSVDRLDGLFADLAPGARTLRPLAAAARPAIAQLRRLVPQAEATVSTATKAIPDVTQLLTTGAPFLRKAAPVLQRLQPIVGCIAPYAPETAGFLSNWASFTKNYDGTSHYARVRVVAGNSALNDTPDMKTDQFLKTLGTGTSYAGLRPPGVNGDKPQFDSACGVGPDVLDPAKDWEDGR